MSNLSAVHYESTPTVANNNYTLYLRLHPSCSTGTGRNAEHRNAECGAGMPNPGMPNPQRRNAEFVKCIKRHSV